jgi:hypothetical protein
VKETVYHLDHQGLRIVGLNLEAVRNDEEGLAHPTLAAGDGSRQWRRRRVWVETKAFPLFAPMTVRKSVHGDPPRRSP